MATRRRASASTSSNLIFRRSGSESTNSESSGKFLLQGKKADDSARPALLRFEQLPEWLQDNPQLKTGYRPELNSAWSCFVSLSYLHNETVNIYSHLLPGIFALSVCFCGDWLFMQQYPRAHTADRFVFFFQLLTFTTAMLISATFHMFSCHSPNFTNLWLKGDYGGILFLTFGNFISGIYLDFYCEPPLQRLYWGMITLFTLLTSVVVISPWFSSREHRMLRLCCFAATAMSGFAPIVHAVFLFEAQDLTLRSGMNHYLSEGALLFLAAALYAVRFPEAFMPEKFDLFGASHQIFHVLVVVAIVVHFAGLKKVFDFHYDTGRCLV